MRLKIKNLKGKTSLLPQVLMPAPAFASQIRNADLSRLQPCSLTCCRVFPRQDFPEPWYSLIGAQKQPMLPCHSPLA